MASTKKTGRQALVLLASSLAASLVAAVLVVNPAPAATLFTNPSSITIRDENTASPYPSEIAVSGMTGPISDISVTLHRFGHADPDDADVLLVSPGGQGVILMSDACGITEVEDFTWTFSQSAPGPISAISGDCGEFAYRPANYGGGDFWPSPAPPGPYSTTLDAFDGDFANGTWRLYVVDSSDNDASGDIEVGWSLSIQTGPVDVAIPGTGTSGPASFYPAPRTVSGQAGTISDINVTLLGVWHQRPDDLDLLLVGPRGQSVVLMSDACGSFGVKAYAWVWSDESPNPMPDGDGTDVCGGSERRPTDYEPGDVWPTPAPAGPHSGSLSAFDGTNPNGEWRLFVNDDTDGATGFFVNRFSLSISTNAPPSARNNSYKTKEDKTLKVRPKGVLANDRDADADTLKAILVRRPKHGRLNLNPNGAFTYKPKNSFRGKDRFVYRASDGAGNADTATATITIRARPK